MVLLMTLAVTQKPGLSQGSEGAYATWSENTKYTTSSGEVVRAHLADTGAAHYFHESVFGTLSVIKVFEVVGV